MISSASSQYPARAAGDISVPVCSPRAVGTQLRRKPAQHTAHADMTVAGCFVGAAYAGLSRVALRILAEHSQGLRTRPRLHAVARRRGLLTHSLLRRLH